MNNKTGNVNGINGRKIELPPLNTSHYLKHFYQRNVHSHVPGPPGVPGGAGGPPGPPGPGGRGGYKEEIGGKEGGKGSVKKMEKVKKVKVSLYVCGSVWLSSSPYLRAPQGRLGIEGIEEIDEIKEIRGIEG